MAHTPQHRDNTVEHTRAETEISLTPRPGMIMKLMHCVKKL